MCIIYLTAKTPPRLWGSERGSRKEKGMKHYFNLRIATTNDLDAERIKYAINEIYHSKDLKEAEMRYLHQVENFNKSDSKGKD